MMEGASQCSQYRSERPSHSSQQPTCAMIISGPLKSHLCGGRDRLQSVTKEISLRVEVEISASLRTPLSITSRCSASFPFKAGGPLSKDGW